MTSLIDPPRPSDDDDVAFCATCGHSEFAHAEKGNRRCLLCGCNAFIVGAVPEVSAQVFPA
jgi:hypothetical protein